MKIIEKEINGNNLVQAEDNHANEIISNVCLKLIQSNI
jgi:hypothetical protein